MERLLGIFDFTKKLIKKIYDDDIIAYAYQLTYSLLIAVFPFLMFLFTLMGYFKLDINGILKVMHNTLPQSTYRILAETVIDVVQQQRGELLSFSIILAIYTASVGFRAFIKGTNKAMGLNDRRSEMFGAIMSIFWVILFCIVIILLLVGVVFGENILTLMHAYSIKIPLLGILDFSRIILPVALVFFLVWAFYMFVPAKIVKPRYAVPGAVFTTIIWSTATFIFQIFVNNFSRYTILYGALAGVIILLIWLLLSSVILLLGVEVNALLIQNKNAATPYFHPIKIMKRKLKSRKAVNSKSRAKKRVH